jgi:hypothetical protein
LPLHGFFLQHGHYLSRVIRLIEPRILPRKSKLPVEADG